MRTEPADRAKAARGDLLIVGASGHGRVVGDAALASGQWVIVRATDRDPAKWVGELLPGVNLIANNVITPSRYGGVERDDYLDSSLGTGCVHIAIGHNLHRETEAGAWGLERLATLVHPGANVSAHATVAAGCFVAARAVVAVGAQLAVGCIVNHGAVVDHDVRVGAFSHIAPNATLGGGVTLGARVLIGAGAVVLPGISVCDDVVVGAGAVVRSAIREAGIYVGVPARKLT
jgi:sugar O-acyltransferase (sialic acid O-acetyltransferase NeuD family)